MATIGTVNSGDIITATKINEIINALNSGTSYTAGTGISISGNVISCTLNGLNTNNIQKITVGGSAYAPSTPSGSSWILIGTMVSKEDNNDDPGPLKISNVVACGALAIRGTSLIKVGEVLCIRVI